MSQHRSTFPPLHANEPARRSPPSPALAGARQRVEATPAYNTAASAERRAFSARQERVLSSIAEAILSDEDEAGAIVAPRPSLVSRVVTDMSVWIGHGSGDLRRGFRVLLFLLEWLPLLIVGTFSRATRLPVERRLAYLRALEQARIGLLAMLVVALKIPITMAAYEVEPELRLTGLDRRTITTRRHLPSSPPAREETR